MSASFSFLGFAALVVLAYHARTSAGWRQMVLLVANVCFLATFSHRLLSFAPLVLFLIFGYGAIALVAKYPNRAFLLVLVGTLASFVWLKKYAFVPATFSLPFVYVTVGISYILFRVLHLIIDTKSGGLPEQIGALSYFNYTCSFLTLVSGPIQLYPDYRRMQERACESRLTVDNAVGSLERVIRGFFKVNVLALVLSALHGRALEAVTAAQPVGDKWIMGILGVVLYPLFLYCNFSGYIDIVIGLGYLFGFSLPENFNRPFAADNFIDFWSNRWHITLSSWLRNYVYNPLLIAMMRRFPSRRIEGVLAVFAFFVTFFLVGIWHGQNSEFLMFGVFMGLGVSLNKTYQLLMIRRLGRKQYNQLSSRPIYIAFARGLTFTYFVLSTILFWSNWAQMAKLETALGAITSVAVVGGIFCGATIVLAIWETARSSASNMRWSDFPLFSLAWRAGSSAALLVIIIVLDLLMNQQAPDIVYKAF